MAHPKNNAAPAAEPKPAGKKERYQVLHDINMGQHRPGDIVEFSETDAFGLLAVGAIKPLPQAPKAAKEKAE